MALASDVERMQIKHLEKEIQQLKEKVCDGVSACVHEVCDGVSVCVCMRCVMVSVCVCA